MSSWSHIGRYRILRLIRRGGQGSVYLGYDDRLQRRVAVKLYTLPAERKARRRVLDEARVIAAMDSPKVVKVYDVISAGDHLAMIMEYVPGTDLEELLQQVPLSLNAIISVAIDVGSALASVRQRRLVHGDLKASNVLIDEGGRAVLTDFGIARPPGRRDTGDSASISALSPEQLRGETLDVRSDLFAMGCLLYRMISGCHPFVTDGRLDTRKLLERDPPPLPAMLADGTEVPELLNTLVVRMLRKEPSERPDNTHRVRQMLREVLRTQPQSVEALPLAGVRSLLRGESEEELPPALPAAFRRRGRSQLREWRGFSELNLADVKKWLLHPRVQLAAASIVVLSALAYLLLWPEPRRVRLFVQDFKVSHEVVLPADFSADWLRERVCRAALVGDGSLRFYDAPASCPKATAGLPDNRPPPPADEELGILLRCSGEVCLVGLTRATETGSGYQQSVLLSGMSAGQWDSVVSDLARASYTTPAAYSAEPALDSDRGK